MVRQTKLFEDPSHIYGLCARQQEQLANLDQRKKFRSIARQLTAETQLLNIRLQEVFVDAD